MARDKLTEYSATAGDNTVCGDVNIAENSALPSDLNNFAREIMSHLKNFSDGTDAIDALNVDNLKLDANTLSSTDTNGDINITPNGTGAVVLDGLSHPTSDGTAGQFLKTDGSGNLSFASAVGKIKQIVTNNVTTSLEVGSGVNPDWSQAATTITPTSNTNPILVIISCFSKSTSSATQGATNIRRKKNSGNYGDVGGELRLYNTNGSNVANNSHFTFQRWDNPTRDAGDSLTYTLDLRRVAGSDSVWLIGTSNYPANFTLIEFEGTTETNGA